MPPGRAGSLESLRRLNRLRVIRALRDEGQISRADIARRTGLSRSTVSSLVADLQADGLVVERPEPGSAYGAQGGRPPILLSFDASAGAAVGVDFGHSHLRVAVSDLASTILAERTRPLDTDHDAYRGPRDGRRARGRDARRRGRRARDRDRRRHGPAGPGRPGRRHRRLVRDPARLDRHDRGRRAAQAARHPGDGRQRRQPRRARRGRVRRRPRRRRSHLPEGLLRHRRGADPQRPPVPRQRRAGGRARPRARQPRRHRLPLRQPRLPGDGRGHRRAGRPAATLARRGPDGRRR